MSTKPHTFHIPVMGTGFTIDTPLKVARYGIDSVISLVDDTLIEQMRAYYAQKFHRPYRPITKYEPDFRARRITAYLDLVHDLVQEQCRQMKKAVFEKGSEITRYFELLPETSPLKQLYRTMLTTVDLRKKKALQEQLRQEIAPGEINVNIMTKLDRNAFTKEGTPLSPEFSDALAALRGFAKSRLNAAVVFSAGINQRLYSYIENFKDFYADKTGALKKRIILKVSDYRSALIQGKFLAKKGLWVSEFRIESGLNCGGHAFATTGYLMGPILEEFKAKRDELRATLHKIMNAACAAKNRPELARAPEMRITAQGGIGTADEDRFLREYYGLDGTGWGSPFLLCPEAVNVDEATLQKLAAAQEKDLYLSEVSPLGVPFNNLRNTPSDQERDRRFAKGRPGSACPKGHLVSNTEFTRVPICSASRQYQKLKIESLEQRTDLDLAEKQRMIFALTRKSCICHDLGQGVLVKYGIQPQVKKFPAVCPGPNIAYFSKIVGLDEIVGHIYGRNNILSSSYRPHMFLKELKLYIDYFVREVKKSSKENLEKPMKYFEEFQRNLGEGMAYYRELFPQMFKDSRENLQKALNELISLEKSLRDFLVNEWPVCTSLPAVS